ncbi:MAG: CBS domain-containing protein [Gemmatimonadetes bacterium]|nr:CBS domain-containing protein [Gemmatimonadota bacterium]
MRVADLMRTDLVVVDAETTVAEAVVTLADAHVSALPVVDSRRRLLGVLSTTDVLQAEADAGSPEERERLFEETTVRDIMTPEPRTIGPEADVREAAQQMLYLEVHRLFVEEAGKLTGVISQSDVVRAVATARI